MARNFNKEQEQFLTNAARARAAGVETATVNAVETALLSGLDYCAFDGVAQPLDDGYLVHCQDFLWEKAYEMGKSDTIKWVGFEG